MSAARASADRRPWRPEPEPEPEAAPEPEPETAVDVALRLLRRIAEDPLLRPSYRAQARRYLRKLGADSI